MAATTLSISRRTSFEQRLTGLTSIAVVVPAVAGLGIRKTGCIAKSISPVGVKWASTLTHPVGKRPTRSHRAYPITVTGEMQENIPALGVEFNSLRGWLACRSLLYRLCRNSGVNRPRLQITCGYRTQAEHRALAHIDPRAD
jgi:hypothetical protein